MPSIRSKAPTCAPPARRAPSPCWPRRTKAALLHRARIATWRRSSSARRPRAPCISMPRGGESARPSPSGCDRAVNDLVVIVLDRPRHEKLIEDIRARRRAHPADLRRRSVRRHLRRRARTNVHAVMGIGGAPEGVLTAAALRCLNGGMEGRLVAAKPGPRSARSSKNARRRWASPIRTASTPSATWRRGRTSSSPPAASPTAPMLHGVRFFGHGTHQLAGHVAARTHRPLHRHCAP